MAAGEGRWGGVCGGEVLGSMSEEGNGEIAMGKMSWGGGGCEGKGGGRCVFGGSLEVSL